jgi:hypothetical protein
MMSEVIYLRHSFMYLFGQFDVLIAHSHLVKKKLIHPLYKKNHQTLLTRSTQMM